MILLNSSDLLRVDLKGVNVILPGKDLIDKQLQVNRGSKNLINLFDRFGTSARGGFGKSRPSLKRARYFSNRRSPEGFHQHSYFYDIFTPSLSSEFNL